MKTLEAVKAVALNKVLFATDFSPCSEAALPYASQLANQYGAKLFATHVLSPETYLFTSQVDAADLEKQLRFEPHQVLGAAGDISDVLFRIVQDNQIDLLILGTHGRTGLSRLFMGSVAEKIFRQAPIPVLTIGPNAPRSQEVKPFTRIVFATDLSDESLAALPYAISLVQDHRAHLSVLHVLEGNSTGMVDLESNADFVLRQMRELAPPDPDLGIYPDYAVEFGSAPDQILKFADEHQADVIVLGVRALRAGLGNATHMGRTTAHQIVGHSSCSVLTVRG